MSYERPTGTLSRLSTNTLGVFRGGDAVAAGVSRKQLARLKTAGVIERELPDVYRMTVVKRSSEQRLRAALTWAGRGSAVAGLSAGEHYRMEGVHALEPEIVVSSRMRLRADGVIVHRMDDAVPLMLRRHRGLFVTGVEATLVALAARLDAEPFEVACEDARRRGLTSVPALHAYLDRFARRGLPGVGASRGLLDAIDPVHPARSTLEVKTRRLLVAHGLTDFVREFPMTWNGRTYWYDFVFAASRTVLETNGRTWHDDPNDFEHDNEKWSVPGRHGYKIVHATWDKVVTRPDLLVAELTATLAA
jgi:hypothetical protein